MFKIRASLSNVCFCPILGTFAIKLVERSEACICVSLNWVFVDLVTEQSLDDPRRVLTQVVGVVAALLHDNDFRANFDQFSCHVEVHERAQLGPAKLVVDGTVEAARNKDQVRLELSGDWEKKFVAGMLVLIASQICHFVQL